jgi:1-deoxy-D-xylulose-5-phosphate synthase
MWDLSLLRLVPGIRIAAPRDAATLREELREAVAVDDGPTVVRFAKGSVPVPIPALERLGGEAGIDVLRRSGDADVLLVAVGALAPVGLDVADRLTAQGIGVTVVDPRWVVPVADTLLELAAEHRRVVVVEDNLRDGGVASAIAERLGAAGTPTPVHAFGVPPRFIDHATRAQVLEEIGLTAQDVSRQVVEIVAGQDAPIEAVTPRHGRVGDAPDRGV